MPGEAWPWKKTLVGRLAAFLAVEEVAERHFVQRGGRGEGGNVPADAGTQVIRAHDHRHRVPTDGVLQAAFELAVAGVLGLLFDRDRVDVGRVGRGGITHAAMEGPLLEPIEQKLRPSLATATDDVIHRVEPFGGFLRVVVGMSRRRKRLHGVCCVTVARLFQACFMPVAY